MHESSPSGPAVVTDGLSRSFGDEEALSDLTLDARPGEVLALLGPNGAGKTTTIRLLNGVLTPDRGSATVLGLDPTTQGDDVRNRTGVLTENAGLDDRLTARENLRFAATARHLRDPDARVTELLERFSMDDRADLPTAGFSTGQRKRLALARALLHEPEVLFLDEPTSGLDPAATRDVVDLIAGLARDHGRTIVLCTHFLAEAGELADRMAVLHRGTLHAFGRPDELAADLWHGLDVVLDLGTPAGERTVRRVQSLPGVLSAHSHDDGALVTVADRAALPGLNQAMVDAGIALYGLVPRPRTLEDVYFAVEARAGERADGAVTS